MLIPCKKRQFVTHVSNINNLADIGSLAKAIICKLICIQCLKTKGSKRQIPLVGAALEAMKVMHRHSEHPYLFKNYTDKNRCNGNSASAALNKWLKPRVPQGCVVHSFRHSMRDRLRAADVNPEIIDDICGWSSQSVGQSYGDGYSLERKYFAINSLQKDFVCLQ